MWYVVIALVALALTIALIPRNPKLQKPQQGTLDTPTASEGGAIPVLFGTREFKSSNIVWYGDVKTVPVKAKL